MLALPLHSETELCAAMSCYATPPPRAERCVGGGKPVQSRRPRTVMAPCVSV